MLFWKAWIDTRWQFLAGLVLLIMSAAATVFAYPKVLELMPLVPATQTGELASRVAEALELARTYRGFVWSEWFAGNLQQLAILFAILLGAAGTLTASGGALYTLSLPISRSRLIAVRAVAGLVELLALMIASSLLIPLLSPSIGQRYSIGTAIVHALVAFVVATVFFQLTLFLSSVFTDRWRPVLLALCMAFALTIVTGGWSSRLFSAEAYFRRGEIPWPGLIASTMLSIALHYAAIAALRRRDF
jgi:hypothetical protein